MNRSEEWIHWAFVDQTCHIEDEPLLKKIVIKIKYYLSHTKIMIYYLNHHKPCIGEKCREPRNGLIGTIIKK